jgi:hypothetical protein
MHRDSLYSAQYIYIVHHFISNEHTPGSFFFSENTQQKIFISLLLDLLPPSSSILQSFLFFTLISNDFILSFFRSQQIVPAIATTASKKFNDCVWLRKLSAVLVILLIGFSNAADMVSV